jgi:hypothetical protein
MGNLFCNIDCVDVEDENKFKINRIQSNYFLNYQDVIVLLKYVKHIKEDKNTKETNITKEDVDNKKKESENKIHKYIMNVENIKDDEDDIMTKNGLEIFSNLKNTMSLNIVFLRKNNMEIIRFDKNSENKMIFKKINVINSPTYKFLSKNYLKKYLEDLMNEYYNIKNKTDMELTFIL